MNKSHGESSGRQLISTLCCCIRDVCPHQRRIMWKSFCCLHIHSGNGWETKTECMIYACAAVQLMAGCIMWWFVSAPLIPPDETGVEVVGVGPGHTAGLGRRDLGESRQYSSHHWPLKQVTDNNVMDIFQEVSALKTSLQSLKSQERITSKNKRVIYSKLSQNSRLWGK